MPTDMITIDRAPLARSSEATQRYSDASRSANTKRAYASDWHTFTSWAELHRVCPLPAAPASVADYIAEQADAGKAVSTIQRRLASISQAHQLAGYASPITEQVRTVLKGIRRTHGSAQRQAAPIVISTLKMMIAPLLDMSGATALRDRALLLVGFAGAFRRSELVSLDVEDLHFTSDGLVVTLKHSKTDQDGQGTTKGIPYGQALETCPIRTLRAWLLYAGIDAGPVFRPINRWGAVLPVQLGDRSVANLIKQAATRAGLDPRDFSGHSLRAGLATAAASAGVSDRQIMRQTGHKSARVLERYIREGSLFRDNAAAQVGL